MMLATLLTDFGWQDEYVGVVKGVILGLCPQARFVDISHEVPPGDVERAGWLLAWAWSYFPKGTVHVAVVDPGVGSSRRILCLRYQGHLFVAPDNGVLSPLLAGATRFDLFAVTNRRYALKRISSTFHGRDIMAPAAAHLLRGLPPHRLGARIKDYQQLTAALSFPCGGVGKILTFDRYGNAVTSLSQEALFPFARQKIFIRVRGRELPFKNCYSDVARHKPLAVIGSRGLLEISVRDGSAASRLHLRKGDPVRIGVL